MPHRDPNNDKVLIDPDKCTGCLNCQLICSLVYADSFNPARARIMIGGSQDKREIHFTEECTACKLCIEHCVYGTLEAIEEAV
ncbi:MAG: 4Fe-4S dicluster domain-containing protein [Proteobacteria bacterium]|nr:4Fe-4S dicluster domain-containing protein [Pseudomonadota bacterium]